MAGSKGPVAEPLRQNGLVVRGSVAVKAGRKAHEAKRADSKRPVVEEASSRCPRCLNRRLCKYGYGLVSPASTDLREDLYKRQIW